MAERIAPQDAVFFLLEGRTTPYHMGALLELHGPAPSFDEICRAIGPRLRLLPRFHSRLASKMGAPAWTEDEDLDLGYHVRCISLPSPGDDRQLKTAVARLMAQHLNRHRPLWEMWVIDMGRSTRSAVLLKAHHALIDGVTAAHDLELLLGGGPLQAALDAVTPDAATSVRDRPGGLGATARRFARAASSPTRIVSAATDVTLSLADATRLLLAPAPRCTLNRRIGPNRGFEFAEAPLQDFKIIKASLGGTVNDVVMAAIAGALRRWFLEMGEPVDGLELRALVPVSLRRDGDERTDGNVVTGVIGPLPVFEADPKRRLSIVRGAMHSETLRRQGIGNAILLQLPTHLPRPLGRIAADVQSIQRYFNISVPNIRGPEDRLRLARRPISRIVPIPPLSANAGLIICALSYAGAMTFGLMADPEVCPRLDIIAEGIEKEVAELRVEAWA